MNNSKSGRNGAFFVPDVLFRVLRFFKSPSTSLFISSLCILRNSYLTTVSAVEPSNNSRSYRLHFIHQRLTLQATPNHAFLPSKSPEHSLDRRPVKQLKRVSPKASLVKSTSHLMDVDLDTPPQPSHAVSDLRSCHACQKAPKRKKDLENYMDCRRCEGRTCFICARQCVGCTKAICKKCIVEVGEDGDAWCLDCYSRNINS